MPHPSGVGTIDDHKRASLSVVDATVSQPSSDGESSRRTWLLRLFYGAQMLLAATLFAVEAPRVSGDLWVLFLLIALNMASERWPISVYGDTYISVGLIFTMAIIITFGAPGAVILAPLEAAAGRLSHRKLDARIATNAALFLIVYTVAAMAYGAFAPVGPDEVSLGMVAGAASATGVIFALTAVLLAAGRALRGNSLSSFWENHRWLVPHFLGLGVIGLSLAAAYVALGLAGVIAFLTPAVIMRLAIKQYVDKTADNVERLEKQNAALQTANVEISRVSDELRQSYDGTLEALVNALDARDQETKGHSLRVSRYMMDIAGALGVEEGSTDWIDMQRGSLLHDVGKIGVSDTILLKPGKLDDDEWTLMRRHPEIGYGMLREVKFLQGAAEIILAHHERWDGNGYPRGLKADGIPVGARIFNVVDTFDSMTSDRPYRKAETTQEAMDEILRFRGSQFDPIVVEAFLDIYETWVKERERMHAAGRNLKLAA